MQKHPRQMQTRHFIPAVFVTVLSVGLLTAPFVRAGLYLLGVTAGSYLLANIAASVDVARGTGLGLLLLLPVVFTLLHMSYGIGFVAGLFKFRRLWRQAEGTMPPGAGSERIQEIE